MNKPETLNSKIEESVTEPEQEKFKSRIEISETDAEQVAGGNTRCGIYVS